jgi:hypothetical protein
VDDKSFEGCRRTGVIRLAAVLAVIGYLASLAAGTAAAAKNPVKKPAAGKPTPAAPAPPPPPEGRAEMSALSFLSGSWKGKLDSYPVKLDISIRGGPEDGGRVLSFDIQAVPKMGFKIGIEGDYRSQVSYSQRHHALRAVLTDTEGRGVEMLGEKIAGAEEWVFNSTEDGAPFPFRVRLKPLAPDQIVVGYSSGGRIPLRYEVTFNKVES